MHSTIEVGKIRITTHLEYNSRIDKSKLCMKILLSLVKKFGRRAAKPYEKCRVNPLNKLREGEGYWDNTQPCAFDWCAQQSLPVAELAVTPEIVDRRSAAHSTVDEKREVVSAAPRFAACDSSSTLWFGGWEHYRHQQEIVEQKAGHHDGCGDVTI